MDQAVASGKTVEDALEKALKMLGASRDEVEYVVLDEGRRGAPFGIGARDAVVRVERKRADDQGPVQPPDTRIPRTSTEAEHLRAAGLARPRAPRQRSTLRLEEALPRLTEEDFLKPPPGGREAKAVQPRGRRHDRPARPAPAARPRPAAEPEVEPNIEAPQVDLAAQVIDDILRIVGIDAEITIREPETIGDGRGTALAVIDITGDDLGPLIGRRGESLLALQYLVNHIVARRYPGTPIITLDAAGYRRRREEQLVGLAQRMAERVRRTRQPIPLEPMPAAERRIIHLALADHPDVVTHSIGEGEGRKVVISPRR